jgi:tRNA 5-methylaminomethyl-2-thiouridine biosynthesis bifunctional protein
LLASLDELFPDVFCREDVSSVWAGFRTLSMDRVPLVGAIPDKEFFEKEYADICHGRMNKDYLPAHYLDGLYISAAHGSRGFTTCLLSAQIIAAAIEGEPAPVSKRVLDYLGPSRFIVNNLKRR